MSRKISEYDYKLIAKRIVCTLYNATCWGTGHMLVERLNSGIPPHLKGFVPGIIQDLTKNNILKVYGKTKYGVAVYLNVKRKQEIQRLRDYDFRESEY